MHSHQAVNSNQPLLDFAPLSTAQTGRLKIAVGNQEPSDDGDTRLGASEVDTKDDPIVSMIHIANLQTTRALTANAPRRDVSTAARPPGGAANLLVPTRSTLWTVTLLHALQTLTGVQQSPTRVSRRTSVLRFREQRRLCCEGKIPS